MSNIIPFPDPAEHSVRGDAMLAWAKANTPAWALQPMLPWDGALLIEALPFVTSHYWSDRHSLNVFCVVGTAATEYIGMSWLKFLHCGTEMPANLHQLARHPGYYHETEVRQAPMYFISLDGARWFVNGEGNHRICLARFHFERLNAMGVVTQTMLHGLTVDDYRIDWAMFGVFRQIKSLLEREGRADRIEVVRQETNIDLGNGWRLGRYRTELRYRPLDSRSMQMLDLSGARALLAELLRESAGLFGRRRRGV